MKQKTWEKPYEAMCNIIYDIIYYESLLPF